MTEQELLNQNNETFRDEGSDSHKLKGKTRAAEARGFFANIIAWVKEQLQGKADLVDGKVPAEQLPEMGTTINSTDDILTEGATNKWFTDARVYLAKASNYVIQGTTRAITQNDTLGMILGIFENRLNTLGQSITSLANSLANYMLKPADREVASTGNITLTFDSDAEVRMNGGQMTGPITLTFTGGSKSTYQLLTFRANGSASVTLPAGAINEKPSKGFDPNLNAENKLFVRCGQDSSGAIKYFYQWV